MNDPVIVRGGGHLGGSGNFIVGVMVGFLLMIALFWLPVIGPLIAGFVAGVIAGGGPGRGGLAGFLSGITGAVLLTIIVTIIGTAFLGPFGVFIGFVAGVLLFVFFFGGAILALIGGAVGGLIRL